MSDYKISGDGVLSVDSSDVLSAWLKKEAQRHRQSSSDKGFTSRRRSRFKHRAKNLEKAAVEIERLQAKVERLEGVAETAKTCVKVLGDDSREMRNLAKALEKSND